VDDIGIKPEMQDDFITMYGIGGEQYAYRKIVNAVEVGGCLIEHCAVDFGLIDDEGYISGLLGLDLLMKAEAIIDLKQLDIRINSKEK
jgi:hypothetical protein